MSTKKHTAAGGVLAQGALLALALVTGLSSQGCSDTSTGKYVIPGATHGSWVTTVAFQAGASATTDESAANHGVTVVLSTGGGVLAANLTVNVTNTGGSATAGADYTAVAATLTFPAGAANGATQVANVPVLADTLVEGAETVVLTLAGVSANGALGTQATHTATITDDEAAGTVAFTAATSASTDEASGTPGLTVTLTLAAGTLASPVTVVVSDATGGTATSGTDYTAIAGTTLTFPAGSANSATQTFTIPVTQDTLVEGAETVNLSLGTVTGTAALGTQTTHIATITDDDVALFSAATNFGVWMGINPRSVAVGDFDGDGKQDLAVTNNCSANVSILIGDGLGGFAPATTPTFGVGINPVSVAVGDFDGDGKQDLAVVNQNSNNVSILIALP